MDWIGRLVSGEPVETVRCADCRLSSPRQEDRRPALSDSASVIPQITEELEDGGIADALDKFQEARSALRDACADLAEAEAERGKAEDALNDLEQEILLAEMDLIACGCK